MLLFALGVSAAFVRSRSEIVHSRAEAGPPRNVGGVLLDSGIVLDMGLAPQEELLVGNDQAPNQVVKAPLPKEYALSGDALAGGALILLVGIVAIGAMWIPRVALAIERNGPVEALAISHGLFWLRRREKLLMAELEGVTVHATKFGLLFTRPEFILGRGRRVAVWRFLLPGLQRGIDFRDAIEDALELDVASPESASPTEMVLGRETEDTHLVKGVV